jgi:glycosyltransferase involved in cell wall biosynthesis
MTRAIIFDATRLFIATSLPTPRGIDRADLDYARDLTTRWPGEVFALLPTPWGVRLFSRALFIQALDYLDARWCEQLDADHDPGLAQTLGRLAGARDTASARRRGWLARTIRATRGVVGMLAVTGFSLGVSAKRTAPDGAIYLNIGYLSYVARFVEPLLRRRRDLRPVYLLHDVIPIEFPEFVLPIAARLAKTILAQIRRHAIGLIFNTDAAMPPAMAVLARDRPFRTVTIPCPLAPVFLTREAEIPAIRALNYFIICGAIEPRKNHAVLLRAWQILVARHGAAAPKLLVIGSVAPSGQAVIRELRAAEATSSQIIVASGLSSPAVRRLIAHARGMLMPSFAEGFGLPVIEALSQGTPVLAADNAVMREAAGRHATYLDPTDGTAWADAVDYLLHAGGAPDQVTGFAAITRADYFAAVHHFLEELP